VLQPQQENIPIQGAEIRGEPSSSEIVGGPAKNILGSTMTAGRPSNLENPTDSKSFSLQIDFGQEELP
jgi:hypothetical protein